MFLSEVVSTTSTATVASVVGSVSSAVTAALVWVGDVASTVASTPVLLIFTVLPLVGLGVGLFKRMINN